VFPTACSPPWCTTFEAAIAFLFFSCSCTCWNCSVAACSCATTLSLLLIKTCFAHLQKICVHRIILFGSSSSILDSSPTFSHLSDRERRLNYHSTRTVSPCRRLEHAAAPYRGPDELRPPSWPSCRAPLLGVYIEPTQLIIGLARYNSAHFGSTYI
jgi:hypothetical protein